MPETHTVPVAEGEAVAAVHHEAREGRSETSPSNNEGRSETSPSNNEGRRKPAAEYLVFCHGFRSDKTGSYERRCERAAAAGYDAVRFDFRGSGESDRAFVDATLSSRIADLRAVVEYFDPGSYVLFGSSFGCKVALHAGADDPRLSALVGRAPVTYNRAFDGYREAVAEAGTLRIDEDHAVDERFFEDFARYEFADVAAAVDVPVAFFHGDEDGSVPLADSLEAAAALETDVLLQKYRGEGHVFSAAAEERLLRQTFDWLAA